MAIGDNNPHENSGHGADSQQIVENTCHGAVDLNFHRNQAEKSGKEEPQKTDTFDQADDYKVALYNEPQINAIQNAKIVLQRMTSAETSPIVLSQDIHHDHPYEVPLNVTTISRVTAVNLSKHQKIVSPENHFRASDAIQRSREYTYVISPRLKNYSSARLLVAVGVIHLRPQYHIAPTFTKERYGDWMSPIRFKLHGHGAIAALDKKDTAMAIITASFVDEPNTLPSGIVRKATVFFPFNYEEQMQIGNFDNNQHDVALKITTFMPQLLMALGSKKHPIALQNFANFDVPCLNFDIDWLENILISTNHSVKLPIDKPNYAEDITSLNPFSARPRDNSLPVTFCQGGSLVSPQNIGLHDLSVNKFPPRFGWYDVENICFPQTEDIGQLQPQFKETPSLLPPQLKLDAPKATFTPPSKGCDRERLPLYSPPLFKIPPKLLNSPCAPGFFIDVRDVERFNIQSELKQKQNIDQCESLSFECTTYVATDSSAATLYDVHPHVMHTVNPHPNTVASASQGERSIPDYVMDIDTVDSFDYLSMI